MEKNKTEQNKIEENIGREINRVVGEINNLIYLKAKKLDNDEKKTLKFDEKLVLLVTHLPLRGAIYSYNFVINSDDFGQTTRKKRIECLLFYKALLKETWKDFLKG